MTLNELYGSLTGAQRHELAKKVETSPAYLWQIATRWNGRKPSMRLLSRLAQADKRLDIGLMVSEFSE